MTVHTDSFKWPLKEGEITSADLIRECGNRLTDRVLWEKFQQRFRNLIFKYLLRSVRSTESDDVRELVNDLAQEVQLRLVQSDAQLLRSFKGTTDFSVLAFLARVCMGVAADRQRAIDAAKRKTAQIISIEELRHSQDRQEEAIEIDVPSILSLIDVKRLISYDEPLRHEPRQLTIFKLHYLDGIPASEIARFAGFNMDKDRVEYILKVVMARLRKVLAKP